MKSVLRYLYKLILILLFAVLLLLAAGFFAVRWGWTNVAGEEDFNSAAYNEVAVTAPVVKFISPGLPTNLSVYGENEQLNWCRLGAAATASPYDAAGMLQAYRLSKSEELLKRMLLALELRLGQGSAFSVELSNCRNEVGEWNEVRLAEVLNQATTHSAYTWQNSEHWQIIKEAIIKDRDKIEQAAKAAGVQPRLLVSVAIVEQLRLYYTQREFYEKFFKPLKILANANKMAWGVMSIKEKMAIQTEQQLVDKNSSFYPGDVYADLLKFNQNDDVAKERYRRLTDEKNHYYSYLYGALIIKQLQAQWRRAGYDLQYRPEIIATLFNIGFNNSQPKDNPSVGGSTLDINGEKYFFGSLAYEFYYSGELAEEFPFN